MYGESSVGKSFIALDAACCVATGKDYLTAAVEQGDVLILVGEGEQGMNARVCAWEAHYGLSADRLFMWTAKPSLVAEGDVNETVKVIGESELRPKLIVIDTLSTHAIDCNENDAKDMAKLFRGAKRLADAFHCFVLIIHHSVKDGSTFRGSSVIKNNANTLLRVEKSNVGPIVLKCEKQKDGSNFEDIFYELREVEVLIDGEVDGTLVAVAIDEPSPDSLMGKDAPLTANEEKVLEVLKQTTSPMRFTDIWDATKLSKGSIDKAIKTLKLKKRITKEDGKQGRFSLVVG